MTDLLAAGLAVLDQQQRSFMSRPGTYRRGAQSVTMPVTMASQVLQVSDREGNTKVERPDPDILFSAADLDFGAGPVPPQSGDLIDVAFGTVTKRFELMPAHRGAEPAWRYCDPFQFRIRAHTKLIGTV